ncbi:unnamed protein product [Schistosoma bovis]|nr:unnamed protein product [Schistosoma bovis]CAH8671360.1 unnamed protein product [Schistosoma bovis]
MSPDAFQKDVAQYGDCVIIDLGSFKNLTTVLKKGDVLQTRFGALRHDDCVGKKYGSKSHSLGDVVKVDIRDVCNDYFPPIGSELNPNGVDAVVLDLPRPWVVIPHLGRTLRPDSIGRVCLFSPCIEQVQRSCTALLESGFQHISTVECLEREYDVSRTTLNIPNMGQQTASIWLQSGFSEYMSSVSQFNKHLLPPPKTSEIENIHCKRSHPNPELGKSINPKQLKGIESSTKVENSFTWEPILQPKMRGHTGYITFATWIPSTQPNVSSTECTEFMPSMDE